MPVELVTIVSAIVSPRWRGILILRLSNARENARLIHLARREQGDYFNLPPKEFEDVRITTVTGIRSIGVMRL